MALMGFCLNRDSQDLPDCPDKRVNAGNPLLFLNGDFEMGMMTMRMMRGAQSLYYQGNQANPVNPGSDKKYAARINRELFFIPGSDKLYCSPRNGYL